MSRDSLPSIQPPGEGWDMYWRVEPRMLQEYLHSEEWRSEQSEIFLPQTDAIPDTSPCNENGDPFWDEGRFGGARRVDVYNVLLLRNLGQPSRSERIGVGKMSYQAFHHTQPKVDVVIIK
jgi:hypothetical protein